MAMDTTTEPLRLNLGAGDAPVPGYLNLDIKTGTPIDALPYEDGTVDEIRASHVLEHVPYFRSIDVLRHWHAKLKRGGRVLIAVPDFDWCIAQYQMGGEAAAHVEPIIMGGQGKEHDHHGSLWNHRKLEESMAVAGFDDISSFVPDADDTCRHPCSIRLMGTKPERAFDRIENMEMILSVPRLGFTVPMSGVLRVAIDLGCNVHMGQGCFWGQVLERAIVDRMDANKSCEWICTVDYDSVIEANDVRRLMRIATRIGADAMSSVQVKRESNFAMLTIRGEDGKLRSRLEMHEANSDAIRADTAHFGLTLLRVEALRRMPHPWFYGRPAADGTWNDGRVDDDTAFWLKWGEVGNSLYVSPRVKIGHLQQVISWPDPAWEPKHQYTNDYATEGKPLYAR